MPTDEQRWIDAQREAAAEANAEAHVKPLAGLLPAPGPIVPTICRVCGKPFEAESVVFPGARNPFHPTVCERCEAREKVTRPPSPSDSPQDRRQAQWVAMVGTRYAKFDRERLPAEIQPHVDRVLSWTEAERVGIGLLGAPKTGKSPLIYALAQRLYLRGVDVFPTSGIVFQREYMRGIEEKERWAKYLASCECAAVLLIDDADKLNFSPGVESEYYGMLEERRNWERPVLCTLNLDGEQLAGLARDRADRAAAIVERLRDLAEFITV